MTYNLSSIMTRAWEILRTKFDGHVTRYTLRFSLQDAWRQAKAAVNRAAETDEVRRFRDAILLKR
ncbi:MAG: hypothetical protein AAF066_17845 [Pseudomonadota bacterium]